MWDLFFGGDGPSDAFHASAGCGEEWSVVSPDGVAVREGRSLFSPFVQLLQQWDVVRVSEVVKGRANLCSPVAGWVSVTADDGSALLAVAEPEPLCCPISNMMFRDPVLVPLSGHTYERANLEMFWENSKGGSRDQGWPRDPMTNVQLPDTSVYPNLVLRHQVQVWLQQNTGRVPDGWPDIDVPPIHLLSRAPEGARFGGFAIGQRVCAAHTIVVPRNETPIKKGELGVFKGPILPYDRAVSEGIAQIVWDCGPTTPLTVSIRDVAAIDKRLSILKRQLHERQTKGLVDELLEKQVTRLTEAAAEKEETLERTTLAKVEQLNYGSETRIWEMVQAAMLEHHAHAIHEEDLGPLLQDNFRKALKKLVRLHVVEKYTPRTRVAPRLFRLCRKPLNFARIAGSAAALAVVAAALHLDCAAQAADASDDATDPLAGDVSDTDATPPSPTEVGNLDEVAGADADTLDDPRQGAAGEAADAADAADAPAQEGQAPAAATPAEDPAVAAVDEQ